MKTLLLLVAAGIGLAHAQSDPAAIAAARPDPNGNLIGLTTPNGRLVYDFIDMWFNQHMPEKAWDTYVARTGYMNHAVYSATTDTEHNSFEEEKAQEARAAGPGTHFDIEQIVAQGNLVFVHIAATNQGRGEGESNDSSRPPPAAPAAAPAAGPGQMKADGLGPDEMVMILRVKNGKIVDHWDMHVPTNSNSIVFKYLDR